MPSLDHGAQGLFGALLKHWRGRRGLSQLALSLESEVSSRHISFLETGRAKPGRGMILRLGEALDIPPGDQNAMLRAAGFELAFEEPSVEQAIPAAIKIGIDHMKAHQEPYPLIVLDTAYNLIDSNMAAMRLLEYVAPSPMALSPPINTMAMFFEDALRPAVVHWERTARALISRLQREVLLSPGDERLSVLLESLLSAPGVPPEWRQPDFRIPNEPVFVLHLRRGPVTLAFVSAVTVFSAPQNSAAEALRVESYFPMDETTRLVCAQLSGAA